MTLGAMGKSVGLRLGMVLALSACTTGDTDSSINNGVTGAGSSAPPPTTAGSTAPMGAGSTAPAPTAGTTGQVVGAGGSGGTVAPPAAGTTGGGAGAAGMDMMATAGSSGMAGEAGAAGGAAGSGPDTSGFMQDCKSGGSSWGMPNQAGPCASGVTIYGVNIAFGPYGARSEYNVGQGFENAVSLLDSAAACSGFIDGFGADPIGSADLKDIHDLDLSLYSVFYPGVMPEGEKYPLITWGNGTCAMPEGYGTLLRYIASHGYIVVAANSRYVGDGSAQRKAIDFMLAENGKQGSKYYQRIDPDKIGAAGHSQGGMGTVAASSDARIKTVILFNGGTSASKPFLSVSGERDIFTTAASQLANPVNAAQRPAAYIFYHQIPTQIANQPTGGSAGHLTLMMEPERVNEPTVAWFDMMLKGSATAKMMFLGDNCTLCNPAVYPTKWIMPANPPSLTYGHNAMLQ